MQNDIVLDNRMTESLNKADKEFHSSPPFNIQKADEDKRLVFGWALVSADKDGNKLIDHQGDMVEPDDLEDGAYEYVLNFRDAGEEHIGTLRKKARMVESCVFTPEKMRAIGIPEGTIPVGWWIGFYVDDDTTWERIKSGKYKMFSIEGKAVREPVTKNAFDEWLEDHLDADEETQRRMQEKMDRPRTVAKSFSELIEKFNPYHDRLGRFASGNGGSATFMTMRTKDPKKQHMADKAIARAKEKAAAGGAGVKAIRVTAPDGTTMTYRDRGNGHITDLDGYNLKDTNNLSIKQIHQRAKQMGYNVETFDDKQLGQHDENYKRNREIADRQLNDAWYSAAPRPRKGFKGH